MAPVGVDDDDDDGSSDGSSDGASDGDDELDSFGVGEGVPVRSKKFL